MSAEALADWLAGLPTERQPQDSQQLARELVRQKKLTAHQAKEIYAGRSKTLVRTPETLARFHREVKAAARLNHANIVVA